jgi:hypothetical protein
LPLDRSMDRAKLARALRFTTSAVFGVLCRLLLALWIRSYWRSDMALCQLPGKSLNRRTAPPLTVGANSIQGRLSLFASDRITPNAEVVVQSQPVVNSVFRLNNRPQPTWAFGADQIGRHITVPHWFPTLLFGALAAVPWIRWCFSLRTLLLVTTLVAIVLGLAMWAGGR